MVVNRTLMRSLRQGAKLLSLGFNFGSTSDVSGRVRPHHRQGRGPDETLAKRKAARGS